MYNRTQIQKYGDAQSTVGKGMQIIMLYNGMIKFMKLAKEAVQSSDIEGRYNNTEKASKIITGLQASLDFDASNKVSGVLDSFYSQIFIKMMQFNVHHDEHLCDEIISDLESMRNAWKDIDESVDINSENIESKGSSSFSV